MEMEHLRLHDVWLYIVAALLFGVLLLILYALFWCSERRPLRKRRRRRGSILHLKIDGSAQNLMPNFCEWKGELPTYVSQWSFQEECDAELEWKHQLEAKSHCAECEKLLEDMKDDAQYIVAKSEEIGIGKITAV